MRGGPSCSVLMRRVRSVRRLWGTVRRNLPCNDLETRSPLLNRLCPCTLLEPLDFGGCKDLQHRNLLVSKKPLGYLNQWRDRQEGVIGSECFRILESTGQQRHAIGKIGFDRDHFGNPICFVSGLVHSTRVIFMEYQELDQMLYLDPYRCTSSFRMDRLFDALLYYGLNSSRRAPDALHPYGYSKERFVWSLISAVGIFCLGSGATIVHGIQNLWGSQPPTNIFLAALVIGGSFLMEGASLIVALGAVRKGAAAEGMNLRDYVWRGHDPTAVAVMMEVAVFLIQRNRHALIGRAIDAQDMRRVLNFLSSDPVVDAIYDCKSEVIGLGFFRFNAEIDFNRVAIVQNYHQRTAREVWAGRVVREEAVKVWDGPTGRAKCTPVFRTMCETKIN